MYLCIFPYIAKFHLLYCKKLGLSEKKVISCLCLSTKYLPSKILFRKLFNLKICHCCG